jgi:hypothetical protein
MCKNRQNNFRGENCFYRVALSALQGYLKSCDEGPMNTLPKSFLVACVLMIIFSGGVFACSCAPVAITNKSIDVIRKEKRNYFLNEFSGAAFVGKIINRRRVKVNWVWKDESGQAVDSQMYKYTIRVSEYWLGVTRPTIIVYGEPSEWSEGNFEYRTSCGFKLNKGNTYFFTPGFYESNLTIGLCDYAGGGSDPLGDAATEFRTIMGEPKRF